MPLATLGTKPGLPSTWSPPGASPRAKAWFAENPVKRAWRYLSGDITPDEIETLFLVGIESFTTLELARAVASNYDVMPRFVEKSGLEYKWGLRIGRRIIINNWEQIQRLLVGVPPDVPAATRALLRRLQVRDPAKARILSTPQGYNWLMWTDYNIINLLRAVGNIDGKPVAPPPEPNPHLERLGLPVAHAVARQA